MSMTPQGGRPASPAKKPGRGRAKWMFALLLAVFGGGFYSGAQSVKKYAKEGHPWIRKILGVEGLIPSAAPAPQPAPLANPSATPAPTVPTQAPSPEQTNAPKAPETQTAKPETEPALPPNADRLDRQVREYNLILRQIQEAYSNFTEAQRISANPATKQGDLEKAVQQQSSAAQSLVDQVHKAQSLYDQLHGDSQFDQRYKETSRAIADTRALAGLPELSVDNLKLVRPR